MKMNKNELLQRFKSNLDLLLHEKQHMLLLLSVSGGIDSMLMATLMTYFDQPFEIVHLNFQLRGEEANLDEALVAAFAKKNERIFHAYRVDTKWYAAQHGVSTQMAARALRQEAWRELEMSGKKFLIAIAHHLGDSLETAILNLAKGTGIAGLSGIARAKANLIRPMLCFTRAEILFLAESMQVNWREDASNQSLDYQRNKIRHQVIPVLENINSALFQRFQVSARHIAEAAEIHRNYFLKESNKHFLLRNNIYEVSQRALQVHPYGQTLLYEFLKDKGFHEEQVQQIFQMMREGLSGKYIVMQDTTVLLNRRQLLIYPKSEQQNAAVLLHEEMEEIRFAAGILNVLSKGKLEHLKDANHAYLNQAQLQFPLIIRPWKKGDYFYPFGMKRKKKKLSDFLVNQKISMLQKEKTFVLISGEHIVWVIGMRIDDRFRVEANQENILHLKFSANE